MSTEADQCQFLQLHLKLGSRAGAVNADTREIIAFEVFRNNERLCVAGLADFGVLTAILTWVARSPEELEPEDTSPDLFLHVGGLKDETHLNWTDTTIEVGDEIKIHVAEASAVDAPTSERRRDPAKDLEDKKSYVRRMAKELGWDIREP